MRFGHRRRVETYRYSIEPLRERNGWRDTRLARDYRGAGWIDLNLDASIEILRHCHINRFYCSVLTPWPEHQVQINQLFNEHLDDGQRAFDLLDVTMPPELISAIVDINAQGRGHTH